MFPKDDEWDFSKMHDDITDATKTMIASGLIDPKRIGIMGGSFGGYLAISGVVNEPDLYRCAVTNAGVFDWAEQIEHHKYYQYGSPVFGRMVRKLGDPKSQPEKFEAISPGRHVERIRVPVFVAGGKDDSTVEISQSRHLISELEKHRVPHETLLVREEGHGMGNLDNQVELYGRSETFLARHLMAKP
jgi:dipeptidyl aminopeptidase/acylaminoacyl peptidase